MYKLINISPFRKRHNLYAIRIRISIQIGFQVKFGCETWSVYLTDKYFLLNSGALEGISIMQKERILVVEDEEDILELVRYNLAREGYQVFCVTSGEEALKIARTEPLDLIVLDLMLPGIDGLEVAKRLKNDSKTKDILIIMLTAKGAEADIVTGLELGADDYITKPFSPRILLARIRAILRRKTSKALMDDKSVIQIHELKIHPGMRDVSINGESVKLTYTEFQVLYFLASRPGWVFTRYQIVDAVRGDDYPVTDRSVDVQIVGLRKKLGHAGRYIETVRGVGYRFKESL
jgi:two-component system phosphate regulon response regulator PhoB